MKVPGSGGAAEMPGGALRHLISRETALLNLPSPGAHPVQKGPGLGWQTQLPQLLWPPDSATASCPPPGAPLGLGFTRTRFLPRTCSRMLPASRGTPGPPLAPTSVGLRKPTRHENTCPLARRTGQVLRPPPVDPATRSLSFPKHGGRRVPDWHGRQIQKRVMMGLCQPEETGPQLRGGVSSGPNSPTRENSGQPAGNGPSDGPWTRRGRRG